MVAYVWGMETAREILRDKNPYSVTAEFESDYVVSFELAIEAMKEYAKQVAEQALKDAAENATLIYDRTSNYKAMSIDKQSILETEIKLP